MKSIITKLNKILVEYKKDNQIEDVILFGSLVKGKENPEDIDILILFKNNIDKDKEYGIKRSLGKHYKNISLVSKTLEEYLQPSFFARDSILFEGFSLIKKEYLAKEKGFKAFGLFKYETKNLNNVKKTTFYYALNGRNKNSGLMEKYGLIKLSNNSLLVPLNKINLMENFFEQWTNYNYIPILIPERLSKKEILEKY